MTTGVALLLVALSPAAVRGEDGVSSDLFLPSAGAAPAAAGVNPFRAKSATGQSANMRSAASPAAAATTAPGQSNPVSRRAQSDQALLDARRALSVGDLPRAQQFLGQAEQLGVAYDGPGDSPQSVRESIQLGQELAELRKTAGGGEAWRHAYAKYLVTQADALVSWNDLDTATRTANEASQLNPHFGNSGATPQDVLRRITERRKGLSSLDLAPAIASSIGDAKAQTLALLTQARAALQAGDLAKAEALAGKASALGVPESQFAPEEDRPGRLAADLIRARSEGGSAQLTAAALPTTATPAAEDYVQAASAVDVGSAGPLRLAEVPEAAPLPLPAEGGGLELGADPAALLEAGELALKAGDRAGALEAFRAAYEQRTQLDLLSQQRLQGHLQMLTVAEGQDTEQVAPSDVGLLDSAAAGQSVLFRQLSAEVGKRQTEAARLSETDPARALALLREARDLVEQAALEESFKRQLLSRVAATMAQTATYIEDHKSELELDAANREILDEIERERVVKVEVSQRVASLVDQFNKLIDEQRYAEAEVVANRLYELAPDELVAQQINHHAKMIRRLRLSNEIAALSEEGVANIQLGLRQDAADALADSNTPFRFDADRWRQIEGRSRQSDLGSARHIKELEIEQKLRTPVLPRYDETPLSKVIEDLSRLANVNIHLDPRGLEQEGVRSDTPITLNSLLQEISLKSALMLILEPLHLTYTVKDEVLKITSEQISDGEVYIDVYPVGDLVIPIPNFVPNNNIGLQGLINDAYHAMGADGGFGVPGPMAVVTGQRPGQGDGSLPTNAMAQFGGPGPNVGGAGAAPTVSGPGGLGGAASADFDSLIDLIVNTVEHDSWMENGTGEGEIQEFPGNLSLVISQTQRVHEQIADLLEQLRRLQDLQVTIEVRFIRLTDSFFERIGVDFDFNIEDGTGITTDATVPGSLVPGAPFEPRRDSTTVGIEQPTGTTDFPNYTVDLDLPFRQGGFGASLPSFGQFDANPGASFGFAILSDIEAFFLINASQGDRRANVLQAPKVTLFNGQQANVIDAAFVPFVISVIPVVGDFAAAQQPVIVVLSEGTMMTVQAVVSDDRRYVRLTLVPFFSHIGQVREFTFEGSTTTSSSSSSTDDDDDGNDESNDDAEEVTRSGTTVQLPTFEIISVSTTVSVPDGGTVLLGGIKRLREGRNEFGVPLLSKVPYIDRLFRNVGIGRETDSLMMMVTPHIIIQEEEEERLGVATE
jgi:general secretion pathway protein D